MGFTHAVKPWVANYCKEDPKRLLSCGSVHPRHSLNVQAEMDNLVAWHLAHMERGVSPEVEAAWLHHRFTQIHPFQDGNGRVSRALVTYVLMRADLLPLVIDRDRRTEYLDALEGLSSSTVSESHHSGLTTNRYSTEVSIEKLPKSGREVSMQFDRFRSSSDPRSSRLLLRARICTQESFPSITGGFSMSGTLGQT